MIIPTETRNKWKLLWLHGDIKAISDYAGSTPPTVRKALSGEYCSMELAGKLSEFYEKREKEANKKLGTLKTA